MFSSISSTVTPILGLARNLEVLINVDEDFQGFSQGKSNLIIVLDISGSMGGSQLNNSKTAIKKLAQDTKETSNLYLITYNSYAQMYDFSKNTVEEINAKVDLIQAGSTTCFTNAFAKVTELVNDVDKKSSTQIIFFTDGKSYPAEYDINDKLVMMASNIKAKLKDPQIHCLGYGREHDATLIGNIAASISGDGTVQYISESSHIYSCLDRLTPILTAQRTKIRLVDDSGNTFEVNMKVMLTEEGEKVYHGSVFIPPDVKEDATFQLQFNFLNKDGKEETNKYELTPVENEPSLSTSADKMVSYVSGKIIQITRTIVNSDLDTDALDKIQEEVKLLDAKLDELYTQAQKIKLRSVRKATMQQSMESKQIVTQFWEVFKKKKIGALGNEDIARMNDLAYRRNLKKGVQRKLDQRATQNASFFSNILYKKMEEIEQKYEAKEDELSEKYDEADDMVCFMTTQNWVELLCSGDCVGYTMTVNRSQAVVADPAQMNVESVGYGCVSASAFQDAYEYKLKNETTKDSEDVHGGFSRKSGQVLEDSRGESFNAMIPLYVSDEHWESARNWIKIIMGLTTTLDPLGYQRAQLTTVPFLALATALQQQTNEPTKHHAEVVERLTETCLKIYEECSTESVKFNLRDHILKTWENYIEGENCTVDKIPNFKLFIAQLYVCQKAGDLKKFDSEQLKKGIQFFVEEESRRNQKGHRHNAQRVTDRTDVVFDLLGIDADDWVNPQVEYYKAKTKVGGKGNKYRANMVSLLQSLGVEVTDDTEAKCDESGLKEPKNMDVGTYDGKYKPTQIGAELIKRTTTTYSKYVTPTQMLWAYLGDVGDLSTRNLVELGLKHAEQELVFAIQNHNHWKSSYRRESFEDGSYVDPFDAEACRNYLQDLFATHITRERSRLIRAYMSTVKEGSARERAEVFGNTKDEVEAAGALLGTFIGYDICHFYKVLQKENCPCVIAKVRMIVSGNYKGKKIYADNDGHRGEGWKPRKRNVHQIWLNNYKNLSRETWENLFMTLDLNTSWDDWYADLARELGTTVEILEKPETAKSVLTKPLLAKKNR